MTTHRFQATGVVEVDRSEPGSLDPESLSGAQPAAADALGTDIDLETEAAILQSNILALRTIDAMKLASTPDYQPRFNIPNPLKMFSKPSSPAEQAAYTRAKVLKTFLKRLTIKPESGTRLIDVSYASQNAQMSADVVNHLVQELTSYGYEQRLKATTAASQILGKQLGELRVRSEQQDAQVAAIQAQTGLYSLGQTDSQGKEQSYSAILDQFQHAATALSEAEQNTILKQAIANAAQTGDAELLSSLAGNGSGASASITNSLTTIEALRTQQATLQGQLDQLTVKFGPHYPPRQETESSIAGIQRLIADETNRIRDRARNDADVANKTYQGALQNYNALKAQAESANSKTVTYMINKQEADESRTLYEDLLRKLNEAGILEQLHADRTSLVDPAVPPVERTKPPYLLVLAGGVVGGLLLGMFAVLLANVLDKRIHSPLLTESLGIPVLALVPPPHSKQSSVSPDAAYIDAVQSVRARLMGGSDQQQTLTLVTSTTPLASKDAFCLALATSAANAGLQVLLVEADLRRPALATILGLPPAPGLTDVLAARHVDIKAVQPHPHVANLSVLPAGTLPADPTGLLSSDAFADALKSFTASYDFVLLDGPPVLSAPADIAFLAKSALTTIQLVQLDTNTETSMRRAHELLIENSTHLVGVVFTDVSPRSSAFRSYYGTTDKDLSSAGVQL